MKKIIAVFIILLMMSTLAFANIFPELPPSSPVYTKPLIVPSTTNDNSCIFGNANLRVYADQMDKSTFTAQDSFLVEYKAELDKQLLPAYLRNSDFRSYIDRDKVLCAMKRIPMVSQKKKLCTSSNESGTFSNVTPCVTDQVVDYIYWGLNEAMRCYDGLLDNQERKIIFKKINHESAFGFFFQYSGGMGIAQLITESQKDLFLRGNAGNNFISQYISSHPRRCQSFLGLMSRTAQTKSLKSCEFMSIGDGVGRSLVGGIGLYLHYRSDKANPYSAEKLLNYWGYTNNNSDQYKQVRSYITLGMYNKGPGAIISSYKNTFSKGAFSKKSNLVAFNSIMAMIKHSNFYGYVKAVEGSTNLIFDRSGSCKI